MELRHLRYAVTLAEELHFGRAAQRLMIAQPPLSQQIRKLEEELGARLFLRTKRRVELTDAGRAFVEGARQALDQAERAAGAARRAHRGEAGRLEVGYVGSAAYQVLPAVLRRFRQKYPGVEVLLREMTSEAQAAALRVGGLAAGFVRPPLGDGALELEVLLEEDFVAALPGGHRLARSRRVALAALAGEPFVLFPRHLGPQLYDPVLSACHRAGFSPQVTQEAMQMPTIVGLVAAGMGVALVPRCARALRWRGVVYRDLRGVRPTTSIALARRRGDEGPAIQNFVRVARQTAAAGLRAR